MRDPHRMVLPATPRGAAEYALNYGWQTAELNGSSARLLNVNGHPTLGNPCQVGYPSVWQPFESTAARFLLSLNSPAGVLVANVIGAYLCANAGNQLDSLAIGPALVQAGGALDSREAVGLGQAGSFVSKVAVELLGGAERYGDAGNAYGDANASIVTTLTVFRINPNTAATETYIVTKKVPGPGGIGWGLSCSSTYLRATGEGSLTTQYASIAVDPRDGAWHYAIVSVNDTTKVVTLHSDLGTVTSAAYTGSVTNAASFHLGIAANNNFSGQIAVCYVLDAALLAAAGTAYWRHAQVPVPYLHARTNPLIAPISPSRVACYSGGNVGQAAVGYDAGLVSAALGNPLGNGYVADAGETFEPIGSDDFYGTTIPGAGVVTSVDGSSGMRDGISFAIGAAWLVDFATSGPRAIVGASNVSWWLGVQIKRPAAPNGTTSRAGLYFQGDGGGPETFTIVSDAATPLDWERRGGTCTPIGAAHNTFYVLYGAALAGNNCDFAESFVIKNRATDALAWRRTGVAAAVTTTPSITVNNGVNRYYNALTGSFKFIISGFQGVAGATFFSFGAVGAAGAAVCDYNAGQMRVRIYDNAGALAVTMLCGPVTNARHEYSFDWSTQAPLRNIGGAYAAVSEGATVLGAWLATWTPAVTAPATLYIGADSAAANPARCLIELA